MYLDKKLCKNCYLKVIEHRLRKHMRINKLFKKNDTVLVKDPICEYLLQDFPIKIIKKGKYNKKVLAWTLDDEDNMFLEYLFENKNIKENKKDIKLLLPIADEYIAQFCKLKKIKFKPNKGKYKYFLNKVGDKSIKYSLGKSIRKLKCILKDN